MSNARRQSDKHVPLRIAVVSAGLSNPSSTTLLSDRLASAVTRAADVGGAEVVLDRIELRPLAHALADHMLTGFPGAELARAIDAVRSADGLIVVTPVFSASYSGLFKSFFDVLEPGAIDGKPTIIAATAGTARHQLALDHELRPLLSYLRAVVMPTGVFAASEDFGSAGDTGQASLDQRIERAAHELAAAVVGSANGMVGRQAHNGAPIHNGTIHSGTARNGTARNGTTTALPNDFADPTPFEALLRQASGEATR